MYTYITNAQEASNKSSVNCEHTQKKKSYFYSGLLFCLGLNEADDYNLSRKLSYKMSVYVFN